MLRKKRRKTKKTVKARNAQGNDNNSGHRRPENFNSGLIGAD